MSGKFLKGALVSFTQALLLPLPNVVIFQYNPETITHTWTPAAAATGSSSSTAPSNPLAVNGDPGESFSLTIALDAADMISEGSPVAQGIATATGIYTRLAALEMLLYPVDSVAGGGLLGSVSASVGAGGVSLSAGGSSGTPPRPVPASQVPTVLFVWGPGRIVPVRVTTLTITEKLYDGLLNPTHAEAQLGLRVLTPNELAWITGTQGQIANGAYQYTLTLRKALALANLANSVEDIIGMLPL